MSKSLAELRVGDRVCVKRDLSHPFWQRIQEDNPGDDLPEIAMKATVTDRREIAGNSVPAGVPTSESEHAWRNKPPQTLVRLTTGSWYSLLTDKEQHSEAMYIEAL